MIIPWRDISENMFYIFLFTRWWHKKIFCMMCASLHSFGSYGNFSLLLCYFPFSQLLQHGVTLLHNNSMYIVFYAFKVEIPTWRLTWIANIMIKQHYKNNSKTQINIVLCPTCCTFNMIFFSNFTYFLYSK